MSDLLNVLTTAMIFFSIVRVFIEFPLAPIFDICVSIIISYLITKRSRFCLLLIINKYCDSKVLFVQKKKDVFIIIEILLICVLFLIFLQSFQYLNLKTHLMIFFIWSGIFYFKKLTKSEIASITSYYNLNLGYGAAMWYYKNYLDRILPHIFERKKQYENKHGIVLPNKLYILCPKSCRIKEYIDDTKYIEHCKELPPYQVCHGGIDKRTYNISVYKINNDGKFFRCALEYAQPLKHLLTFKEHGKITDTEMCSQRDLFCENLKSGVRKSYHDVCELIEYDDEVNEIHNVLLGTPSIQEFMQCPKL